MGDLDVCLIKEFACRPGFYDRGDPNFKDKEYAAQNWLEISHQLGYEVKTLKDRIYQLRNRYHVERRRLETLRLMNQNKEINSPWPLFDHFGFLDDHIRPRRSYKFLKTRGTGDGSEHSSNEDYSFMAPDSSRNNNAQRTNRRNTQTSDDLDIKMEPDFNGWNNDGVEDDPSEEQSSSEVVCVSDSRSSRKTTNPEKSLLTSQKTVKPTAAASAPGVRISVRSLESLKTTPQLSSVTTVIHDQPSSSSSLIQADPKIRKEPPTPSNDSKRVKKFEAFGQFLAASLSELEQAKALKLIEAFTTDIVKALNEKDD